MCYFHHKVAPNLVGIPVHMELNEIHFRLIRPGGDRDRVKVLSGAGMFLTLGHEGVDFELDLIGDKKGEEDWGVGMKKGRVF